MARGIVKWFNHKKGFGFIEAEGSGADVFIHSSEVVAEGSHALAEGDRVEFETEEMNQRLRAKNIRKLNLTPAPE
jgi:cold shock protein